MSTNHVNLDQFCVWCLLISWVHVYIRVWVSLCLFCICVCVCMCVYGECFVFVCVIIYMIASVFFSSKKREFFCMCACLCYIIYTVHTVYPTRNAIIYGFSFVCLLITIYLYTSICYLFWSIKMYLNDPSHMIVVSKIETIRMKIHLTARLILYLNYWTWTTHTAMQNQQHFQAHTPHEIIHEFGTVEKRRRRTSWQHK